jgi:DNA replication and repair protein RecF
VTRTFLRELALVDFRSYRELELTLPEGRVVFVGRNGEGKTNVLEAIAWLATMSSFRGVPSAALVRDGCDLAYVRGVVDRGGRDDVVAAQIPIRGAARVEVNGKRLPRARDLLGTLRVTVFAPDDLVLVKGGPSERRRFLDDLVVALDPRLDRVLGEHDRVLRHRNALLKSAGGRLSAEVTATLDVWDAKLAHAGEALGRARAELVVALSPHVAQAYRDISRRDQHAELHYDAPWRTEGLAVVLAATRDHDARRGVTTQGPHRDELDVRLDGLAGRTHRSQGEQRSLALALRLAGHRLVTEVVQAPPLLLLDDVFSELDAGRSEALVASLPPGQTLLTTAGELPSGTEVELVVDVAAGRAVPRRAG